MTWREGRREKMYQSNRPMTSEFSQKREKKKQVPIQEPRSLPYQNIGKSHLDLTTPPPYIKCERTIRPSNFYQTEGHPIQNCRSNYKMPDFASYPPPPYSPFAATTPPLEQLANKPEKSKKRIEPHQIIKELINFNGFFTDVQTLSRIMAKNSNDVLEVIQQNKTVFKTLEDKSRKKLLVELCPSVKICEDHLGEFGCSKLDCAELHFCLDFASDNCRQKNCIFGHSWKTNHNEDILQSLFLNDFPVLILSKIMQKLFKGTVTPTICLSYQEGKCLLGNKCNELHICYLYVTTLGICPQDTKCHLNHNLFSSQCKLLLKKQEISLNEAPRDILKVIIKRLDMSNKIKGNDQVEAESQACNLKTEFQSHIKMEKKKAKSPEFFAKKQDISNKVNNNDQVETKSKAFNLKTLDSVNGSQSRMEKKQVNCQTFCSWHFLGSVASTTICLSSLFGKCDYLHKGCKFLHAKKTYHWQFGINNKWYNFYQPHVEVLENNFRNVYCDGLILPKLNREQLSKEMMGLYDIFGNDQFKVDFEQMLMECKSSNKLYALRHLSTASTIIVDKPLNTKYNWYFRNDQGEWKLYGSSLLLSIEKSYLNYRANSCDDRNSIFLYSSDFEKYEINFSKMLHMDVGMQKIRKVRRRPVPFPSNLALNTEFPKHWQKMKENQDYLLRNINWTSPELNGIRALLKDSCESHKIVSVSRLQNPCLWKHFKSKESKLKLKYDLHIKQLFVGINDAYLEEICITNYDFSKHNPYRFHSFGQGAYFLASVTEALNSAAVNRDGHKLLLIADVIVGKMTEGRPDMIHPPIDRASGTLYDTTVDVLMAPTLFVKYNKDEFYPSYIVKFSVGGA